MVYVIWLSSPYPAFRWDAEVSLLAVMRLRDCDHPSLGDLRHAIRRAQTGLDQQEIERLKEETRQNLTEIRRLPA